MSRAKGHAFEQKAAQYLQQQGLKILEHNYTCRGGEIDLIAKEGSTVVFVEVKFRKSSRFGEPFAAVHGQKQRKIIRAATIYAQKERLLDKVPMRFDVISIQENGGEFEIQWLPNAFTTDGY